MTSARPHEPWILAVDAVSSCCALALARGHWLRSLFYSHSPLTLSQRLLPALEVMLQHVEIGVEDLGCIAVNRGPGSFTALRITFTTLKAFQYRTRFRVLASDTLTLQVACAGLTGEVWSMIPAGRTEYALARFHRTDTGHIEMRSPLHRGTWYQIYPYLQDNDLPILYPEPGVIPMASSRRVIRVHERRRVEALLEMAQRAPADAWLDDVAQVELLYLRPPDIRPSRSLFEDRQAKPPDKGPSLRNAAKTDVTG